MAIVIECKRCKIEPFDDCCEGGSSSELMDGLLITDSVTGAKKTIFRPFEIVYHVDPANNIYRAILTDYRGHKTGSKTGDDFLIDFANTTYPTWAALKQDLESCKCPSFGTGTANPHYEITDPDIQGVGGTAGNPTTQNVKDWAANEGLTDVHIYYIGGGTALDPQIAWHVDINGDTYRYPQGAGGGGIVTYHSGDATIRATDYGITFGKSSGVGTFVIPDNVTILSFAVTGSSSDLVGNAFTFRFDHSLDNAGSPTYDTTESNYLPPTIDKIVENSKAGGGLSIAPFTYDVDPDPLPQVNAVAGGVIDVKLTNLIGITLWNIKGNF